MKANPRFGDSVRRLVSPLLKTSGYNILKLPAGWKGSNSTVFGKSLWDDIYGFIQFQILSWRDPKSDSSIIRFYKVILLRNKGNLPDLIPKEEDYYLQHELSTILWREFNITKYGSQFDTWEFSNLEELNTSLNLVVDHLIQYGIPWMENVNSRNNY